ncbi:MAG TPA: AsmA family protein [Micropepsaceae bacterium]|nr:AsmA family protein [Micropepsaceae bacterium]
MRWSEFKAWLKRDRHGPSSPPRKTGFRALKWTGGIFAGLLAILIIVLATLDWNTMRGPVGRYLSGRLHREVTITGDLKVKLFSWTPSADVNGLVIAQPDWADEKIRTAGPFADVQHLTLSIDLKQLFRGHILLPEVNVEQPKMGLFRDASGRANWNFADDKNVPPFRLPPISHFVIKDGRLGVEDVKRNLTFVGTFSSEENDVATQRQFFGLVGQGQLNRAPFSLDVKGDPLLDIVPDKAYAFDAHVHAGATRIDAKGSLEKPFDLGKMQVAANFVGPDLADLYYLTGLALPNTPPYRLSGDLQRDADDWRITNLAGQVGDSDLHGRLTVDAGGERPYLTGDIASRKLNFDDLGPLIGARAKSQAKGAPPPKTDTVDDTKWILPDTPLHVERLRQMDADVHYRADTVVSRDFPLRAAETKVSVKGGVLKLTPVSFTFSRGTLNGDVQIDARKDVPISDVDVRLTGLRLEQFAASTGGTPPLEGVATARAKLHGVGNSIHKAASTADGTMTFVVPNGQVRRSLAELLGINVASALGLLLTKDQSQVDVHCAVADFSAKNGVMALRQFVFDTPVVMATGEGNVDLKNEQIDLAVTGHPKKPQLVRVRAPITIKGPLDHPGIGVDARSAIVQGGIAAGVAVVLSPLAAILPFVDPGLGKDADCGALLAQADAQGARVAQVKH